MRLIDSGNVFDMVPVFSLLVRVAHGVAVLSEPALHLHDTMADQPQDGSIDAAAADTAQHHVADVSDAVPEHAVDNTEAAEHLVADNSDTSAQDQDQVTDNTLVKLYNLSSGGVWEDGGTGHVIYFTPLSDQWSGAQYEANSSNSDPGAVRECFAVVSPGDYSDQVVATAHADGVLLVRPMIQQEIADNVKFIRQGESIVLWTEEEQQRELALSFQSSLGCDQLWSRIHLWQGEHGKSFQNDHPGQPLPASGDTAGRSQFPAFDTSLETLKAIHDIVEGDVRTGGYRNLTSQQPQAYWQQYLGGFTQLEVADDPESIRIMFETVRNLLVYGDADMCAPTTFPRYVFVTL